jgi:hypothetical protein
MARGRAWFTAAGVTAACVCVCTFAGVRPARADTTTTWPPPPELNYFEMPARELSARPRLSLAVGMGATFDDVGFRDGTTHAVPAFFATGGFGDGLVGVDFGVLASSAIGRYRSDDPVDRVALDAFGVVRPAAPLRPWDRGYAMRVLRTAGLELGFGWERDGRTTVAGSRFTVHLGARVEVPLTPVWATSQLRIRLGASRNLGLYTPRVYSSLAGNVTEVVDTAGELYAALVTVF